MEKLENAEVLEVYEASQTDPVTSSEIEMLPLKPKLDSKEDTFVPENQPWTLQNWLHPPELPRSCQLLRKENIAIPACYLLVGILQGLIGPLINVYPMDLGATEAQYSTISTLRSLPATFKLAFGFLSDNFPICGYKRKSFMMIGWLMASLSMGVLLLVSDLSLGEEESVNEKGELANRTVAPDNAPSIPLLSLTTLLFGTGFWMADVMGDSVVAEKAKLEPESARGSVQSSCYSYRFFGLMVAAPFSTSLYSLFGPRCIISLLCLLPLSILPLVYWLQEEKNALVAPTSAQCKEIWNTVRSRAVWQPLGFVYLYNVLQVGNVAWKEYLKTTLGFTAAQLNSIYVVACVLLYVGVVVYKYYLINWSWRTVYIVTTALNGIFSFLQVLLILGITFGLSNFVFALGDDAFAELIGGIQFLPTTIMMVHLCPDGSEGASYAMFTTVNNSALNLSAAISTQLLRIWDVSKDALLDGRDLSGMINLTILTSLIQISGLAFVGLLPKTREDLLSLKERQFGTSNLGGAIFLSITFLSILYSLVVSLLNIIYPGWMERAKFESLPRKQEACSRRESLKQLFVGVTCGVFGAQPASAKYSDYSRREKDWEDRNKNGEVKYSSARQLKAQLQEIAPMNTASSKIFCPNGPSANVSPLMENKCGDRLATPSVFGRQDDVLGNSIPGFKEGYFESGSSSSMSARVGGFPSYK